ncbi:MAG: hypothetical protein JNL11_00850 [Bdellovibrionaceae bacterium]|nr:hypothetical protein [Pseudobdellovibrionaceae bacterium]
MHTMFVRFIALSMVLFSFWSQAQSKSSVKSNKSKPAPAANLSLVQQAQQAIAVDPKNQVPHTTSPQNTGVLVLKAPELNDDRNPTRFPIGFHFDSYSFAGTATSGNNQTYQYADLDSTLIPSLMLGMIPFRAWLFDAYSLQLGYQQKSFSTVHSDSLSQSHYVAKLTGENKFFVRGKWDVRYAGELGIVQTQITNMTNSLANVTRKSAFVGLGLQNHYSFQESLSVDVGISYRYAFANSLEYRVEPMGLGAGISYIW